LPSGKANGRLTETSTPEWTTTCAYTYDGEPVTGMPSVTRLEAVHRRSPVQRQLADY
jgi:hypothetical protein